MAKQYGRSAKSSAYQWFIHRITGTFLVFLLITHFWVQHYDRTTASISHSVITASEAKEGVLPQYSERANEAVEARRGSWLESQEAGAAEAAPSVQIIPTDESDALAGHEGGATPYDILMLRLADPVYAVLWKAFNILFLVFALHHGFYGLNNIITDYVRNDMARVGAVALSWTVAFGLLVIGVYSVTVAGLNL
ncbi:MAG: succinate dehydrogenase [Bacteroidota bacterium]